MTVNELKERIKSGNLAGAYLFAGEEDYLKRFYLSELRRAIITDEALAPFNHIVYDGGELDIAALSDAIKAPPMMSDYKLVEWRYPDLSSMKEEDAEAFLELLKLREEYGYTVLAFIVFDGGVELGAGKKKSKFEERFDRNLSIIRLDRSSDAQLAQWIRRHLDSEGVKYSPDLPSALLFRSGRSMQTLKNEIDKLTALAKARGIELSAKEVELIATPTTECETFALSNALLARDKQAALAALADMKARRIDATVILGMTARVICDLANVAELSDEGMNSKDIAKALSMNDYKLGLYLNSAKKLGCERARALLSELSRVDVASKFGGLGGYTAIEIFLTKNM